MAAIKANSTARIKEISFYFLKLGFFGFGGPFALMASIQKDLIERRRWISAGRFNQGLALIKALPGPTGTQVAIYMGQAYGGRLGGFCAGLFLILPSFAFMLLLAVFYNSVESLAWSKTVLAGMQAAALGVILESVWKLALPYRRKVIFWSMAAISAALTYWRPSVEPLVIVGAGIAGVLISSKSTRGAAAVLPIPFFVSPGALAPGLLSSLLAVCIKAGAFVFGTGLAIVPLLIHDVVDVHHWLTRQQFMDALAFGQITPGPVVITATFIGFKVAGFLGAVTATFGIFAPAFFNILTWFPIVEKKMGGSAYAKHFVLWALGAVVGSILIAVANLLASSLGPESVLPFHMSLGLTLAALFSTLKTRLPVWAIIPIGGALSLVMSLF